MFIFESVIKKYKTDELCDITKIRKVFQRLLNIVEILKNFNLTYINTFGNLCLLVTQKGLILKKGIVKLKYIFFLQQKLMDCPKCKSSINTKDGRTAFYNPNLKLLQLKGVIVE